MVSWSQESGQCCQSEMLSVVPAVGVLERIQGELSQSVMLERLFWEGDEFEESTWVVCVCVCVGVIK